MPSAANVQLTCMLACLYCDDPRRCFCVARQTVSGKTIAMRRELLLTLFLPISLFIAGCVPYPHRVVLRPEIHGIFAVNGVARQNVTVLVGFSLDFLKPCEHAVVIGRTNEGGQFSVASKEETELFQSLLNPPSHVRRLTHLCFRTGEEPVMLGAQLMSPSDRLTKIALVCDPGLPKVRSPSGMPQICR